MHLPSVVTLLTLGTGILALGKNDKPCKHKVKKGSWESLKVNFPTVETIKADMKKCGNMDGKVASVFYSFGATANDAREFRDSEHFPKSKRPNIFYDTLPPEWDQEVAAAVAKTTPKGLLDFQTQYILNARKSQAMAELSPDSYFMAPKNLDIYTSPSKPDNVWREQEMPALQRLHRQITHITNSAPWTSEVQWPKPGAPVYPLVDADHKTVKGLKPLPPKDEEDGGAGCCMCIVQRDLKKPVHNSGPSGAHCDSTCCRKPSPAHGHGHAHTTMATKTKGAHHAHKTPTPGHPKTSGHKKTGKKTHTKSSSHKSIDKNTHAKTHVKTHAKPHAKPAAKHTAKKTTKSHRKPAKARRT